MRELNTQGTKWYPRDIVAQFKCKVCHLLLKGHLIKQLAVCREQLTGERDE